MEKLLLLPFLFLSIVGYSQMNTFGGIGLRVNDTTTYQTNAAAYHAAGYYDIYFNNQATNDHFDVWNGSSYDHIFNFGSNIYNTNGTLTGTRTVSLGGNDLSFDAAAATGRIIFDADNNVPRIFSFRTNNVHRWAFRVDGDETGSEVGGDFAIRRYNDAGTFVDAPISITRSTGLTTLAGPVKVTSGTPGAGKVLTSDADGDATWVDPSGGGVNTFLPNIQTGNYTAVIGDTIRVVLMRSASAQNFTIPPNVFPIGSYIQVVQDSTGTTTIVAGAGVAFENPSGTLTLTENTFNVLYQKYSNGWIISKGSTGTSGATAAGATGNVQYKSAGGGLQAEAAFTYDSATNVLDVDNVTVDDEVYGAGWNASVEAPTKNALYDKIETLSAVDYTRNAVAISAGTLTLDINSQTLRNFDLTTTVSSAFTIAFSNATNFVQGKLTLRVTGAVAITMPSAVVMDLYEESVGRWDSGTNILTLTGVTASAFMMEFYSDGTNIWCSATNRGL